MKKLLLLLGLLGIATAIGYLIGTEDGRAMRDRMLGKLRRSTDDAFDELIDVTEAASDAVADAAAAIEDAVPSHN